MVRPDSRSWRMAVEDVLDDQRRKAERRLVEQQQARLAHQRARDRQHLLLAARQGAGQLVLALLQAREALELALDRCLAWRAGSFLRE